MDDINNSADGAAGQANEGFGEATGNESLEGEGAVQNATESGSFGGDSAGSPADTGSDPFGGEQSYTGNAPVDSESGSFGGDSAGSPADTGNAPVDNGSDTTGSAGDGGSEGFDDKIRDGSRGADDAANAREDRVGDAIRGLGDKIKGAFNK